jgi:hypothetical protein
MSKRPRPDNDRDDMSRHNYEHTDASNYVPYTLSADLTSPQLQDEINRLRVRLESANDAYTRCNCTDYDHHFVTTQLRFAIQYCEDRQRLLSNQIPAPGAPQASLRHGPEAPVHTIARQGVHAAVRSGRFVFHLQQERNNRYRVKLDPRPLAGGPRPQQYLASHSNNHNNGIAQYDISQALHNPSQDGYNQNRLVLNPPIHPSVLRARHRATAAAETAQASHASTTSSYSQGSSRAPFHNGSWAVPLNDTRADLQPQIRPNVHDQLDFAPPPISQALPQGRGYTQGYSYQNQRVPIPAHLQPSDRPPYQLNNNNQRLPGQSTPEAHAPTQHVQNHSHLASGHTNFRFDSQRHNDTTHSNGLDPRSQTIVPNVQSLRHISMQQPRGHEHNRMQANTQMDISPLQLYRDGLTELETAHRGRVGVTAFQARGDAYIQQRHNGLNMLGQQSNENTFPPRAATNPNDTATRVLHQHVNPAMFSTSRNSNAGPSRPDRRGLPRNPQAASHVVPTSQVTASDSLVATFQPIQRPGVSVPAVDYVANITSSLGAQEGRRAPAAASSATGPISNEYEDMQVVDDIPSTLVNTLPEAQLVPRGPSIGPAQGMIGRDVMFFPEDVTIMSSPNLGDSDSSPAAETIAARPASPTELQSHGTAHNSGHIYNPSASMEREMQNLDETDIGAIEDSNTGITQSNDADNNDDMDMPENNNTSLVEDEDEDEGLSFAHEMPLDGDSELLLRRASEVTITEEDATVERSAVPARTHAVRRSPYQNHDESSDVVEGDAQEEAL